MKKVLVEVHAPVGRSDPQAVFMANSFVAMGWNVILYQCLHADTDYQPPKKFVSEKVQVVSYTPIVPMWAKAATIEFAHACRNFILESKPDLFIAYDFSGQLSISLLPPLSSLDFPLKTIIMQLETVEYTSRFFDGDAAGIISKAWRSSLVVYPEANRLDIDAKAMATQGIVPRGYEILPPTVPAAIPRVKDSSRRETLRPGTDEIRIIYAGSVVEESYAIEALETLESIGAINGSRLRFLVAGPIGQNVKERFLSLLENAKATQYLGVLNQEQVCELLLSSHFSFVGWKPLDANFYYCAPNKFFQALSLSVIPICVPSPIFLSALEGVAGLDFPCISWEPLDWKEQLANALRYYYGRHSEISLRNKALFDATMSWESEFSGFYRNISGLGYF